MASEHISVEQFRDALGGVKLLLDRERRQVPEDLLGLVGTADRIGQKLALVSRLAGKVIPELRYETDQEQREIRVFMDDTSPREFLWRYSRAFSYRLDQSNDYERWGFMLPTEGSVVRFTCGASLPRSSTRDETALIMYFGINEYVRGAVATLERDEPSRLIGREALYYYLDPDTQPLDRLDIDDIDIREPQNIQPGHATLIVRVSRVYAGFLGTIST